MKVLAISGSLRPESHNSALLRAAAKELPPGVEVEFYDGLIGVRPYCELEDVDPQPPEVEALKSAIANADAVLFSTPEYNHSIPGQLKNALDWVSRPSPAESPLRGKPVAVIGASSGLFGAVWAQAELRKVLGAIGAHVLDREFPLGSAGQAFGRDGGLLDPRARAELRSIVYDLIGAASARTDDRVAA